MSLFSLTKKRILNRNTKLNFLSIIRNRKKPVLLLKDILLDVLQFLDRKRLSKNVQLVCRQFSDAAILVPNLHVLNSFITGRQPNLQTPFPGFVFEYSNDSDMCCYLEYVVTKNNKKAFFPDASSRTNYFRHLRFKKVWLQQDSLNCRELWKLLKQLKDCWLNCSLCYEYFEGHFRNRAEMVLLYENYFLPLFTTSKSYHLRGPWLPSSGVIDTEPCLLSLPTILSCNNLMCGVRCQRTLQSLPMYGAEEIVNWLHYTTQKGDQTLRKLIFEVHHHEPYQIYRAVEICKEMFLTAKDGKFTYKLSFAFMHEDDIYASSWTAQAEGEQYSQMLNGFDLYNPVTKERLTLKVDMQHLYLNNSRKLERFEYSQMKSELIRSRLRAVLIRNKNRLNPFFSPPQKLSPDILAEIFLFLKRKCIETQIKIVNHTFKDVCTNYFAIRPYLRLLEVCFCQRRVRISHLIWSEKPIDMDYTKFLAKFIPHVPLYLRISRVILRVPERKLIDPHVFDSLKHAWCGCTLENFNTRPSRLEYAISYPGSWPTSISICFASDDIHILRNLLYLLDNAALTFYLAISIWPSNYQLELALDGRSLLDFAGPSQSHCLVIKNSNRGLKYIGSEKQVIEWLISRPMNNLNEQHRMYRPRVMQLELECSISMLQLMVNKIIEIFQSAEQMAEFLLLLLCQEEINGEFVSVDLTGHFAEKAIVNRSTNEELILTISNRYKLAICRKNRAGSELDYIPGF